MNSIIENTLTALKLKISKAKLFKKLSERVLWIISYY